MQTVPLLRRLVSHRFELILVLLGLVLTLLALLPIDPQGPFNARTYERLPDARLYFTWTGAMLEPASSIGHALLGAPVPKQAAIASLAWVLAAALVWGWMRRTRNIPLRILGAGGAALTAVLAFLAYAGLYFILPFPSWHLETRDGDAYVADLQTHTHYSHDSVISPRHNLRVQGGRGIEITAVTEHKDPTGSFRTKALSRSVPEAPLVVPGVELSTPEGYVLGLGLDPDMQVPDKLHSQREVAHFVRSVHREHNGAVIALGFKLDRDGVARMVQAGVDGFEIVNMGHPDIPFEVRRFIKQQAGEHNLSLVGSSDWHGWTGMWRTWTLVRVSERDHGSIQDNLLAALRDPREGEIVPAVAGYLGPTSSWRVAFAPFVEAARYALELSPKRVLAWWVWIVAAILVARLVRFAGLAPARIVGRTSLVVIGGLLLWKTVPLALAPATAAADPTFHLEIGRYGVALGGIALLLGAGPLLLREARLWRKGRLPE